MWVAFQYKIKLIHIWMSLSLYTKGNIVIMLISFIQSLNFDRDYDNFLRKEKIWMERKVREEISVKLLKCLSLSPKHCLPKQHVSWDIRKRIPLLPYSTLLARQENTTHVHILCIETILCNDEKYSLYGNIKSIGFLNRSICD